MRPFIWWLLQRELKFSKFSLCRIDVAGLDLYLDISRTPPFLCSESCWISRLRLAGSKTMNIQLRPIKSLSSFVAITLKLNAVRCISEDMEPIQITV